MDLNTKIKDIIRDDRAVKLIEELVPHILERRELKLFLNKPIKFVLGKGKYVDISDNEINMLVEKIIQKPLEHTTRKYHLKKTNKVLLVAGKIKQFNSYNDITIPMIIASQGKEKKIISQAVQELIPLVWDENNNDHHLNYEKHFISWNNLVIKTEYVTSRMQFLNSIIHSIQKGFYVYLFVNEGYIKESKRYGKNFDHDICIYGYNSEQNTFNVMGYLNNNFSFVEITFDLLTDAFFNQVSKMPSFFTVKPKRINKKCNKKQIMLELYTYFNPIKSNKGINIYDCVLRLLKETNDVDYRYYSIINDHCYLISKILSIYYSPSIVSIYDSTIKQLAEKIFLLALTSRRKNYYEITQFISYTEKLMIAEKKFAENFISSKNRGGNND